MTTRKGNYGPKVKRLPEALDAEANDFRHDDVCWKICAVEDWGLHVFMKIYDDEGDTEPTSIVVAKVVKEIIL